VRRDRLVDACRLALKVQIERTHDDAGVTRFGFVQPHEVSAIQRHDGPVVRRGQFEDDLVRERLPRLAGIGDGDHVVPDSTQRFDDGERKVLVGKEARHERLRAFVVADLSIDLVSVSAHIGPGAGEIFRPQGRIETEQVSLG